jgi:hypothetical protein
MVVILNSNNLNLPIYQEFSSSELIFEERAFQRFNFSTFIFFYLKIKRFHSDKR